MVGVFGILLLGFFLMLFGILDYYCFYDINFLCIVDYVYYVIVIDEYRVDFDVILWDVMIEKNKDVE